MSSKNSTHLSRELPKDLKESLFRFSTEELDVSEVLETSLSKGGVFAELFFEKKHYTRINIEDNKIDQVLDGIDTGVGLRVIFDRRSVYGYTTTLTQDSLLEIAKSLAEAVEANSQEGKKSKPPVSPREWRAPASLDSGISSYQIKKDPRKESMGEKIKIAQRIYDAAKGELPEARQISAYLLDSFREILTINSDGLFAPDTKTYLQGISQVVGEKEGRMETAYEVQGGYVGLEFFEEVSPEEIGKVAARRVKVLLDAKPAPSGTMTVVLAAEAGGTMIHEAVGHGLEADLACNGLSVYGDKIGQQVASPLISVVDDGTMPTRRGSYTLDDEGTPSRKNVLIENGVLKGYMVDRLSAMKFDLMATGNGRRETFRHIPIVRMTNTYVVPGDGDPKEILASTPRGIYVKAMGGGQVNTVTGDFVFAVTEGYLIHDGKLGDPIRGATLVGNGPKVLSIVDRLGSDLGFAVGTCGKDGQGAPVTDAQPTMRIPELTVGGQVPMDTYWKS